MAINMHLARERGLSQFMIDKISKWQYFLDGVIKEPEKWCVTPREAVTSIEQAEYQLQMDWGFDINKDMHRYWFMIRGCTCPVLDNTDRIGSSLSVIADDCPYHGSYPAEDWDDGRLKT